MVGLVERAQRMAEMSAGLAVLRAPVEGLVVMLLRSAAPRAMGQAAVGVRRP